MESFPELCLAFGPDFIDILTDQFIAFFGDPAVTVRLVAVKSIYRFGEVLLMLCGLSIKDIKMILRIQTVEDDQGEMKIKGPTEYSYRPTALSEGDAMKEYIIEHMSLSHEESQKLEDDVIQARMKIRDILIPSIMHLTTDRLEVRKAVGKSLANLLVLVRPNDLMELFQHCTGDVEYSVRFNYALGFKLV